MAELKNTVSEVLNYLLIKHPELAPNVGELALRLQNKNHHDAMFLLAMSRAWLERSKAQLRQDLFVLAQLNYKRQGYFVDFGATNGVALSNSFLLEKEFGWTGIVAEPAIVWHKDLFANRKCIIDTRCVWSESGLTLLFNQTEESEFSTIKEFSETDMHSKTRERGQIYPVETVSLNDLLEQHNAPKEIDYLSIDTEGSEYDILRAFDFSRHNIKIITCEHNYTPMRDKIHVLLTGLGYVRLLEDVTQFDDWYIRK
jgi:FkbM family methyltransferase